MSAVVSTRPPGRVRLGGLGPLLLIGGALLLWEAVSEWTQGVALSGPLTTFVYAGELLLTGRFWENAGATASAFALAFAVSAAFGMLLGLMLGLWRFAGDVAEPVLAGFYTIPKVTLYPVVLLVFGLGVGAKVAFGVMHGLIPVTLFTVAAIRNLPPVLPRAARSMGLSPWQTIRWVLLPACLPQIVAGLRLGFSLSLLGVLIGEMFSSQQGLGFLLVSGLAQNNVRLSTAIVLVIVVFAIVSNTAMLRLSRRAD